MNFNELTAANSTIKTTDIKGKEYAEVNQRIKAFRMLYPEGKIVTQIESLVDGTCVMSATIFDEIGEILATGHAYEKEDSSFINKTSYIENCETSAVGRALGMVGIGIDTSVASLEEVENAIAKQEAHKKITVTTVKALRSRLEKNAVSEDKIVSLYKVGSLEEMTNRMHDNLIMNWDKAVGKCKN